MHNVCVMARVRPPKNGIGNHINVNSEKNFIDIKEIKKDLRNNEVETSKHYIFDQVFDKDYDNDDLFNDFGMKITFNLIKNIDTTFYVYGQTGSGKTHTITGTDRIPGLLSLMIKVIKKQKLNLTYNKMKKILLLTLSLLALSCSKDLDYEMVDFLFVPDNLKIEEPTGIRLASNIVNNEVDVNVKLPADGTYRIKILDLTLKVVSQEKLTAKAGDNLIKVYVNALPQSSFTVELLTEDNQLLGREVFAITN